MKVVNIVVNFNLHPILHQFVFSKCCIAVVYTELEMRVYNFVVQPLAYTPLIPTIDRCTHSYTPFCWKKHPQAIGDNIKQPNNMRNVPSNTQLRLQQVLGHQLKFNRK